MQHKALYDYKLHTGYIGTSALERFKSHLPGDVRPIIPVGPHWTALDCLVLSHN